MGGDGPIGRIILITGGARSGKSTFAEEMAVKLGRRVLYIATSIPFDSEMKDRVKKHRQQRPADWSTLEAYRDLDALIAENMGDAGVVLLDCITIMVSNLMLEQGMDWESIGTDAINTAEDLVKAEVEKLLKAAEAHEAVFVIVTNELGMGVVPPYKLGRAVRDIAGRANQMIAKAADEVYMCISGIPVKIKGGSHGDEVF